MSIPTFDTAPDDAREAIANLFELIKDCLERMAFGWVSFSPDGTAECARMILRDSVN